MSDCITGSQLSLMNENDKVGKSDLAHIFLEQRQVVERLQLLPDHLRGHDAAQTLLNYPQDPQHRPVTAQPDRPELDQRSQQRQLPLGTVEQPVAGNGIR